MSSGSPTMLYEMYRQVAEANPDAVAVRALDAADLTYRGFMAQHQRTIEALAAFGIGPGDRVVLQLPNGPEPFVAMHGVAVVAGAMLLDPRASTVEIEYFLRFLEPKAIVLVHGLESSGRTVARALGVPIIEIVPTPEEGAGTFRFVDLPPLKGEPRLNGPDDLAYLITTSGTTALPKIVPRTQVSFVSATAVPRLMQYRVLGEVVPMQMLNYLPTHLAYAAMVCSGVLLTGGFVAFMPGLDPERFFQWMDVYRPNFLAGPPPILEQFLMMAAQNQDILARHSVRYINTASAVLTEETRNELDRVFGVPIVKIYGMTEVELMSYVILRVGEPDSPKALGQIEYPERTRIMAPDGSFLPDGEVGEIVFKTDYFTGYWKNPDANADAFLNGWFRTGDEGMIENGSLLILGRLKEVINSGGAKVSPQEIEAVLKQHPQVREAAAFGLKNAEVGETVAAAVVGDVTERELRRFAAERLPFYKVPTRIVMVDAIPTTASGKLQRNRLADLLGLN